VTLAEEKCALAIGCVHWYCHTMHMRVEDIADEALALPSEARALLADRLVESLDPAEDGYIHGLWATEANRRLRELRSGQAIGIPGEEAVARLRQKYAE
jgi:Putative addiction module component